MNTLKIIEAIRKIFGLRSEELHSEKFYHQMNFDNDDLKDYDKDCGELKEPYNTPEIRRIFKQVLKFLKTKSTRSDDETSVRHDCVLLNYWIYDKLSRHFGPNRSSEVPLAFAALQPQWYHLVEDKLNKSYYNACKPSTTIVTEHNWQQRKELYEYCVDYDVVRGLVDYYDDKCEEYYLYLKKKAELYKYFKDLCSPNTGKCPDFYEKCKAPDPSTFLDQLRCHEKMKDMQFSLGLPKLKPGGEGEGEGEEEGTLDADDAFARPKTSDEMPSQLAATLRGRIPNTPIKYGDLLLGVVVTSITLGALYRFKPYRRRLRNGFGWNSTPIGHINEGGNGLLAQVLDAHNPLSGDSAEHFIGYTPV
ncbi:Plasmodium vivax Vir protein, putative [Plasmodium vivax]|nr:Plasmodium vivax Vir protein, putative [Plasmodium vivax]